MLGQLSGKDKTDSSLDLSRRDGALLVVGSKLRGLGSDALKDVLNERVENCWKRGVTAWLDATKFVHCIRF